MPWEKHHRALRTIPVCLLMAGLCLLACPTISDIFSQQQQQNLIQRYEETTNDLDAKTLKIAWAEAKAYNSNLTGNAIDDPFLEGSGSVLPKNYENVLNVSGSGIMGYIEIPSINVSLPIYHGTSEEVLEKGAGHIATSSLPIGGAGTHSVICAHRGLPSALLFARLGELEKGDIFYLTVLDATLVYEVDKISVVKPNDVAAITLDSSHDYVTLLTCTPYGINTQRLLVRGIRVEDTENNNSDKAAVQTAALPWVIVGSCIALTALGAISTLVAIKHRRIQRQRHIKQRVIPPKKDETRMKTANKKAGKSPYVKP